MIPFFFSQHLQTREKPWSALPWLQWLRYSSTTFSSFLQNSSDHHLSSFIIIYPNFPTWGNSLLSRTPKGKLGKGACVHAKLLQSCPTLLHPMTTAHQALLSMGFSRQEYWSGLPCPPPGDLSDPGIKPVSPISPALADSSPQVPPGKPRRKWDGAFLTCDFGQIYSPHPASVVPQLHREKVKPDL